MTSPPIGMQVRDQTGSSGSQGGEETAPIPQAIIPIQRDT